ncbi:hypothetical protein FJY90_05800 [Candidatus Gottesmanbacteria bacterium]|nr:hypothetical protein [Candidatus Gottesmanbacteria bacterium]
MDVWTERRNPKKGRLRKVVLVDPEAAEVLESTPLGRRLLKQCGKVIWASNAERIKDQIKEHLGL